MVSDRFRMFVTIVGDPVSRRAPRRGLLGVVAGGLGFAGAILRGDRTSKAKPKRRETPRRKTRRKRQCSSADDCSTPEDACKTVICRRHRCRVRNSPDGTPCGDERVCRDGTCDVPCDVACTGGRICRDDACVCPESGICEISPAQLTELDGWSISADGEVSFVEGPGEPPLGTGSARLATLDDQGSAIGNDLFDGVPIATISTLGFATYVANEHGFDAADGVPSLDLHILLGGGMDDATLVFEPAIAAHTPVLADVWQTWDALQADARWTVEGGPDCGDGCLMSWGDVLAAFPEARIVGPLVIRSGKGGSGAAGHLDALRINDLTYNFEPDPS